MDLFKKNIHMDKVSSKAMSQITLEEDINIPESKPDVSSINMDNSHIILEEVKPYTDYITVSGKLVFSVLYHTDEEGCSLVALEGVVPFHEKINMQGVQSNDVVTVSNVIEDFNVGIINSRKLSIQSVVNFKAKVDEIYDEEAPIGIYGEENLEYRKTPVNVAEIAICKNDIWRIKEEVTLPASYPNMYQILWHTISLNDMEFKPMEEKLALQGELHLFVLYEGEGDEHPIRSYETVIPISGFVECHGCMEHMIPDITYTVGQKELSIRPDIDGEERVLGLDVVLELGMKLYTEEELELITDIYGVTMEVECKSKKADLRKLLARMNGKWKITERIPLRKENMGIMQMLHSEAQAILEDKEVVDGGLKLSGSMQVKLLYVTGEDENPYACHKEQIPFSYVMEIPDIRPEDISDVSCAVEQLRVTIPDGNEVEVKAVLSFHTTVFQNIPMELISEISMMPLDAKKLGKLPSMAIYIVKPGDNLWNIGKKYYIPVDRLRALNEMSGNEIKVGQKLLIVKGGVK